MPIHSKLIARQIFAQRYSKGEARRLLKYLVRVRRETLGLIASDYGRGNYKRLARQIDSLISEIMDDFGKDLMIGVDRFAKSEASFVLAAIQQSVSIPLQPISANNLVAAVTTKKMTLQGKGSQKFTIDQALKVFTANKAAEVSKIIQNGAILGRTLKQVTDSVVGVVDNRSVTQSASLIRTINNHVGSVARAATYQTNKEVISGERYVATLDSHTTLGCANLDGTIFPIGKGVQTPRHWGCRSLRIPVIKPEYDLSGGSGGKRASASGLVDSKTTYAQWFKKQSKAVQNEVLGKERAKLYRAGKISLKGFTDSTGKAYTLNKLEAISSKKILAKPKTVKPLN